MTDTKTHRQVAPETAEDGSTQDKRSVFYFHGYDPRSNRYYRDHFKTNIDAYLSQHDGRQTAARIERHGRDYVIAVEPETADRAVVDTRLAIPDWHAFIVSTLLMNRWPLVRHYYRLAGTAIVTGALRRIWNVWWKHGAVLLFFLIVPLLGIPLGVAAALLLPVDGALPLRAVGAAGVAILWFGAAWVWLLDDQFRRFLLWSICFVCDLGGLSTIAWTRCSGSTTPPSNASPTRSWPRSPPASAATSWSSGTASAWSWQSRPSRGSWSERRRRWRAAGCA